MTRWSSHPTWSPPITTFFMPGAITACSPNLLVEPDPVRCAGWPPAVLTREGLIFLGEFAREPLDIRLRPHHVQPIEQRPILESPQPSGARWGAECEKDAVCPSAAVVPLDQTEQQAGDVSAGVDVL